VGVGVELLDGELVVHQQDARCRGRHPSEL
jgi:hypothetical protein